MQRVIRMQSRIKRNEELGVAWRCRAPAFQGCQPLAGLAHPDNIDDQNINEYHGHDGHDYEYRGHNDHVSQGCWTGLA